MQIEILNGGEILVSCKTQITIICTVRYRGIQNQSKSQFEFVPRDTDEFEFVDFDYLTKISQTFRISTIMPSFILQASLNVTVFVMCLVRDFGIWAFYHTSLTHTILQTFEGKSFLE